MPASALKISGDVKYYEIKADSGNAFSRGFCPECGTSTSTTLQASGRGTVHARTLVARAPTEELRAHAPYLIVLIDAEEGFRLMAHGDADLQIGDRVLARFTRLAGHKIPYFVKP